jgi:hypothetical protein
MLDDDVGFIPVGLSWTMPGLSSPDGYVVAVNLPLSRFSTPTSDDQGVFLDFTPPTFDFLGDTIAYDEGSRRSSSPVFVEEVRNAAARVTRNFEVKFIVGPFAAIAIAVEIALSLFVELSGRIASGGHSYD